MTTSGPRLIDPAAALAFLVELFQAAGASEANAVAVVDHLLDASLAGLHSHGVLRAPDYLDDIDQGVIDPAARPRLERGHSTFEVFDAALCFGPVAGQHAAERALELAGGGECAVVNMRRAGHLGRIGAYVEAIARAGHLALGFCAVPTKYHNVAWFGTREGRLGTNPMAYAFPTTSEPVVADFSTSALPEGKIRFLRNQGGAAPEGALRDASGRATTDPATLYSDPPGTLQPLGGPQGHKGSALGLLVEAMGTLLAGEAADDPARENNLTLVAVPVPADFAGLATGLVDHIHRSAPLDDALPPMVPGEPEQRSRASSTAILVDPTTWDRLVAHAERRAVPQPPA